MEQKTKHQQQGVGRKGAEENKLNNGNARRGKGNEALMGLNRHPEKGTDQWV
jgi:hypothetical protein